MIDIAKTMTELQPDGTSQVVPVTVDETQGQQVCLLGQKKICVFTVTC